MAKPLADWTGKAAIITGGSSGIGKALAKRLVQQGANVAIVARDPEKLALAQQEIVAYCRRADQQVCIYSADVSDRLQAETAIQAAIAALGSPALLVTCAGIAHPGYFQDLPIEIFERTMAINYFGSLYCIRAVVPAMMAQGQGQIAMISSGAGLIGIYGYTPYSPSKFALRGLAESLRGELKPMGIGVSIVYPPDTDTPQLVEENKTKPPETKRITATAETWSADGVAREIMTGLQKQAFTIAPGTEMSVLAKLHSVIAPGLNWYFDRMVREVRGSRE
ncbi:SDR family oxidoreductase [Leptolyngbya ohadii]|uniref:SDR family oxidoreductase n=1 Tax=Leptolyngbya ohadii TaxID=1962290 RepID=UPI000B59FF74|nr:SDR family oxidoreductase [Leptolyngbya ohadii]